MLSICLIKGLNIMLSICLIKGLNIMLSICLIKGLNIMLFIIDLMRELATTNYQRSCLIVPLARIPLI